MSEDLREEIARALCAALGDDWCREGPSGLMPGYGPLADAILPIIARVRDEAREAEQARLVAYANRVAAYYRRRSLAAAGTQHEEAPRWAATWTDRAEATERLAVRIETDATDRLPEFWTGYGEHLAKARTSLQPPVSLNSPGP